ncbi:MAG TPA: DNA repair protein RadC [Polyangiaceae bacterium]|jgi:DNA repair protein RadC|nr:DNA repair protein RadC [Polyangiaceae bacterium]
MATSLALVDKPRPNLREQALLHGMHTLADIDLLALVLGTGAEGESAISIAARLLDAAGGLVGLSRTRGHALSLRRGIGPAKGARILAALELGKRALAAALDDERDAVSSFDAVVDWARPRLATLEHEEVWLLTLDGRNGLLGATRIAQGGLHGCALTPRDVLRPALRDGGSAIVVIHNHPSGDPTPSPDDIKMTAALAVACDVVGIELLDHVVVARGGATSLREMGAVPGSGPA